MSDPREDFLSNIQFDELNVREYPKIAFLCGGNPSVLTITDSPHQYFPSIRSFISHLLSVQYTEIHYQNAEDVKDWNSYSEYEDLIEFEKDIAHLCKAIVLFVESAGSIAELGSFSVIQEVAEKLVVFVHSDYSNSTSFIALGPLKHIIASNPAEPRVHYIPWDTEEKDFGIDGVVEIVKPESMKDWGLYTCDAIKTALEVITQIDHTSDKYTRTKEALFIHDIIHLFKALDVDEIRHFLKYVSHEVSKKELKRSLFCLEKLGLIRPISRGNKTYYVPENLNDSRYLSLPLELDTARLSVQLVDYYSHHTQLARREAIQESLRGAR